MILEVILKVENNLNKTRFECFVRLDTGLIVVSVKHSTKNMVCKHAAVLLHLFDNLKKEQRQPMTIQSHLW